MNVWTGPLESGFGWHLVRVVEHTAARDPEYAEVEDRVREAFAAERLARANQSAFDALRAGFEIAVEWQSGVDPVAWP
jgi:parvulin-like peptidyl-prolyl isomerase